MSKSMTPAQYRRRRYAYFWTALACYFVPYIVATSCLLPFMVESAGLKWGIGLAVVFVNALPFIGGVLRGLFAHVPFINVLAIVFLFLAGFFMLDVFRDYVSTFMTIEACAAGGSVLACVFWGLHRKYKAKDGQAKTMKELGVI